MYFPVWNHKFSIPIYANENDIDLTLSFLKNGEEVEIGESITNTFELIESQLNTYEGSTSWLSFNQIGYDRETLGKLLVRVKFRTMKDYEAHL